MSEQVTLTLPADVFQRAQLLAQRTGRAVDQVLVETIEVSLRPLGSSEGDDSSLASWTDDTVRSATQVELPAEADQRLSRLLDRQQQGALTETERPELAALMELYQRRLLRKAQALREAVRRGLTSPLQP
jgi:predicted DNA-binding protein